jgi:hypothetical protein
VSRSRRSSASHSLPYKEGANGPYRDFDIVFEHAAPKPSASDLLNAEQEDEPPDDDIPFD